MRIIAFDVGTKKIGVAVGQTVSKTATSLEKIFCHDGQIDWNSVEKIFKEWQPSIFVVGIPKNMDGTSMNMTEVAGTFMNELQSRYPETPTYAVDERLTTKEAKQMIFERYGFKGLKAKDIDGLAAALMLEQWMKNNVS